MFLMEQRQSMIKGQDVLLRALEPADLDWLYHMENDPALWSWSDVVQPYSAYQLSEYILKSQSDLLQTGQYRWVIADLQKNPIGLLDIYHYHHKHLRAAVGIVVSPEQRKKGVGGQALSLLSLWAKNQLGIKQLYAEVPHLNQASRSLFISGGYRQAAEIKDWYRHGDQTQHQIIYQKWL